MGPSASFAGAGLTGLPLLFRDATVLNPDYYAVQALNQLEPAFWDGNRMNKIPTFSWGGRVANAPPNLGFPGWFNINATQDFAISLTRVLGVATGFQNPRTVQL